MSFEAKTIFESDFSDSAERFSRDVGQQLGESKLNEQTYSQFEAKWLEAIEQGWQACLIPEALGGLGGDLIDFCSLLEAASHHALRLPVAAGFGVPVVLLRALKNDKSNAMLQGLAQGHMRLQPVVLDRQACDLATVEDTLGARVDADGSVTLNGRISGVEQVPGATDVLVVCPLQNDPTAYVIVTLPAQEVSRSHAQAERIDGRTTLTLEFDQRVLSSSQVLAQGAHAAGALDEARSMGCLFACVSAAGAMGVDIAQTLQYLRDRHQFGVSLSTFQALRHYMASAYSKYECYRALVRNIVVQANASGTVSQEDLSLLKVYLSQVGPLIAHTVLQVHGGMGMTEALFASRLNKIILMVSMEYGDGQFHVDQLLDTRETLVMSMD